MQLLVYILAYPFLWLVSILPYRLFYGLSDVVFFWIYHVIGYRKKVVLQNLQLVFPEKEKEELLDIRREFYKHFCDIFFEMIKSLNISNEEIKKRYFLTNIDLLKEIEKEKSILVPSAHYANWEWSVSINLYLKAKGFAIYQEVKNPYFDKLVRRIRGAFGATSITQKQTIKKVIYNEKNGVRGIYGLVSDQSPQVSRAQYWNDFMGIKVPIHTGTELLARKLDMAVVFCKVKKVKRGYYEATFIPITLDAKTTNTHEITDTFLRLAEEQIKEAPAYYFWTHKRWKHRNKVPDKFK